jgi:voltage-gated potassium channel
MDVPNGPDRLRRWEQRMELPLLVASLLFLACYAVRVLQQGPDPLWRDLALALLLLTWAAFAVDYGVRVRLSGQGAHFVRTHKLDTVVLVLPLLRPLRIVKVYSAVQRRQDRPRLDLYARVMTYSGLSSVLLGLACSLAVYQQ